MLVGCENWAMTFSVGSVELSRLTSLDEAFDSYPQLVLTTNVLWDAILHLSSMPSQVCQKQKQLGE